MASNGDTAKQMLSGKQADHLKKVLRQHGEDLHLMLFSAGGNDVVGPKDLAPLINSFEPGFDAQACINRDNFDAKLADIVARYQRLLKLRDQYAPEMQIICHTYDYVEPSDSPAEFLWGVEVTGPWIKPTLDRKGIPAALGGAIIQQLLIEFKDALVDLQQQTPTGFHVVDTQGTLTPGKPADWLNEIHPTPAGFKKIARKVYSRMKSEFPQLPAFQ